MIGKLLLPAAVAERMATAQKQNTNNNAPSKTSTRMLGRPPQHLPKRLPRQSQPHRTWNPGLPGKQSDSTRRRRRRSQTQTSRAVKIARWRAARKAAQEAAATARARRNSLRQLQRRQASESEAVSSGGPPLAADNFVNAVVLPLRPGAYHT